MFRKIVLPSDLHNLETPAIGTALDLAVKNSASVMLLHVIEAIQGLDEGELKDFYAMLERNAASSLETLKETFTKQDISVTTHIIFGSRARKIIEFAHQHQADLIVMQSHRVTPEEGSGGWSTISYHVGVFAQCPVLLLK